MAKLAKLICEQTPLQLKVEFALWTLAIIREFDARLSEVLMERREFFTQCPLYRAWQQDGALVDQPPWRRIIRWSRQPATSYGFNMIPAVKSLGNSVS